MVTYCGYDLPLYPNSVFASAPMHDHHHGAGKPHNFSVLLNLSDRLFGTFKPF
jgi:sterol desaturase/sphingolipid hydroxylase (fatty acid hydroxylase superfamily)